MDPILQYLMPEIETLSDSDKEALNEYYMSVKLLSEKSWNLEFNNKDMYHGAIVMSQIFNTAKKEISLFAGNYNGDICGKSIYQTSLKHAILENDVKLKIVFENKPSVESPGYSLLKFISEAKPQNIEIRLLTTKFKETINDSEQLNHFVVADDSIFRYELDTIKYKAFCNFDDKKLAEKLKANFEILEYNSEPIQL